MNRPLIYLIIAGCAIVAGLLVYGIQQQHRADRALGAAQQLQKTIDAQRAIIDHDQATIKSLTDKVSSDAQHTQQAKEVLETLPAIPRPAPLPESASQLSDLLASDGYTKPLIDPNGLHSTFTYADAQLAAKDHQLAVIFPAVQQKLNASLDLNKAYSIQVSDLNALNDAQATAVSDLEKQVDNYKSQSENYNKAYLSEKHSKIKVAVQWTIVGLATGYVLAHH